MGEVDEVWRPEEGCCVEVEWTPIQRGYTALMSAMATPEKDHTEASLREAFERWGEVHRVRLNCYGDKATVVFATPAQAEFASFSATKRYPELQVHLREATVP